MKKKARKCISKGCPNREDEGEGSRWTTVDTETWKMKRIWICTPCWLELTKTRALRDSIDRTCQLTAFVNRMTLG